MKHLPSVVRGTVVGALLVAAVGCASNPPGTITKSSGSLSLSGGAIYSYEVTTPLMTQLDVHLPPGICMCKVSVDGNGKVVGLPTALQSPGGTVACAPNTATATYVYACDDPKVVNPCTTASSAPSPSSVGDDGCSDDANSLAVDAWLADSSLADTLLAGTSLAGTSLAGTSLAGTSHASGGAGSATHVPLASQRICMHRAGDLASPEQWLVARVAGDPVQALVTLSALLTAGPTIECPPHVDIEAWLRFDENGFEMIDTEFLVTRSVELNGTVLDLESQTPLNWFVARCDLPLDVVDTTLPSHNVMHIDYQPYGKTVQPIVLACSFE